MNAGMHEVLININTITTVNVRNGLYNIVKE